MIYRIILIIGILVQISFLGGCGNSPKEAGQLRWAADLESGAPYVYQNPENPNEIIGFEVDIINAVARELKLKPIHVQQQWDGLIPGLDRKGYDVVINGIEITEDRKVVINFSKPYYVTYLQLAVRADEQEIKDIYQCKGKTVGTLSGCFAERYMKDSIGGIDVRGYESEANSYLDLKNGRLNAVFIDYPVAKEYALPYPDFKLVGQPVGKIEYGIVVRKEDTKLLSKIDSAITKMWESGEMKEIFTKWDLWDDFMEKNNPYAEKKDTLSIYKNSKIKEKVSYNNIRNKNSFYIKQIKILFNKLEV
jgi:polar amino acid transport system substrate-binding protein